VNGMPEPWVLVAGGFHLKGGMDRANAALATFLASRGHRVHLVAHEVAPSLTAMEGVTTHIVAKPAGSYFLGDWLLDWRGRVVAREVVADSPGARVVVNGGNCAWPDINWVHSVHRAWPPCDPHAPAWFKVKNRIDKSIALRREWTALRSAKVIIANSERTRRDLVNLLQILECNVHTLYLGSNCKSGPVAAESRRSARLWLGKPLNHPLAAFVGAIGYDTNKGIDTLLRAWTTLCSRADWDVDLVVAGGGRAVPQWKSQIERTGLLGRVKMLGFTERIADVLAAADVLVSPVRYEAYGLNVQEAICCGVPAIVSECAGVAERYPAQLAGLLLRDPANVGELVERMRGWRESIDAWRESVKPFAYELRSRSWEAMASEFVTLVQNPAVT
jgi:glycosyltransferase involved in cell wall biosynthesis